jgi:hypothetical protein
MLRLMSIPRFPHIPLHHLGDEAAPERPFRLLPMVRHRLRARRYSRRTEEAYVYWIRRFVLHNGRRHPRELDEAAVGAYLSHLAVVDRVAASTQNQALAALRFLYDVVLQQPLSAFRTFGPRSAAATCPWCSRPRKCGHCSRAWLRPCRSALGSCTAAGCECQKR